MKIPAPECLTEFHGTTIRTACGILRVRRGICASLSSKFFETIVHIAKLTHLLHTLSVLNGGYHEPWSQT